MVKTKQVVALTAGLVGAAGAAVLSANTNTVSAATGTVTYKDGATTVWGTPAFNQVKRYVTYNETINVIGQKTVNGATWYQIGAGEWIPDTYLQVGGTTKKATTTTTTAAAPSSSSASSQSLSVTYTTGAVTVWAGTSYTHPTGQYLTAGNKYTAVAKTTTGGETWYRLSNGGYVPARFVAAGTGATTSTPAKTTTTTNTASKTTMPAQSTATSTTKLTISYTGGAVTVWASAGYSTPNGSYLTNGTTVTATGKVTASGETWYKLSNGGYVPARFVSTGAATSTPATSTPAKTTTTTNTASKTTTTPAKPATSAPATTTNTTNVSSSASRTAKINAVIALAKQQIGKPYQWGGKGPTSFDCSGLMHYVFLNAIGTEIGGWSVPQESAGTVISVSNLQKGDLVFWGARGASYHVALYLGGGQYLNAPQPGENVQIDSFSAYFEPSFGVHVDL
ncbi:C40 family peptidase [Lacticaseibacillus mingshuiensis]|uniref:C40 family peptidase n=1 Tax=Lacticaseibacillus mingshuiensis TaxID=2799574 RepID=A0ABW4CHY4_9LACO|nr:C40 family peptidase [Lacticaseibacillus mingshuiensis]